MAAKQGVACFAGQGGAVEPADDERVVGRAHGSVGREANLYHRRANAGRWQDELPLSLEAWAARGDDAIVERQDAALGSVRAVDQLGIVKAIAQELGERAKRDSRLLGTG